MKDINEKIPFLRVNIMTKVTSGHLFHQKKMPMTIENVSCVTEKNKSTNSIPNQEPLCRTSWGGVSSDHAEEEDEISHYLLTELYPCALGMHSLVPSARRLSHEERDLINPALQMKTRTTE